MILFSQYQHSVNYKAENIILHVGKNGLEYAKNAPRGEQTFPDFFFSLSSNLLTDFVSANGL